MAKMTFSNKGGRVAVSKKPLTTDTQKSVEDTVREMKNAAKAPGGEDYREKSLNIHGLVCGRCGRDFSGVNRQLLTVHHRDGNHHNNPADGSNWENLCVYCHEDVHSREVLAEYLGGNSSSRDVNLVYGETASAGESSLLAQKLRQALQKKT
ncbi:MAG: YajD family HNH nuclease [Smithellaceae bacterium]|nr:YajD family HNH nuclease [Smithellaceae bacterium]